MRKIEFEGKVYDVMDLECQKVLQSVNVRLFKYYPQENLWVGTDLCADYFNLPMFIRGNLEYVNSQTIFSGDWKLSSMMYKRLVEGNDYVSDRLRSKDGKNYYKISLSVLERDESGYPLVIEGLIMDYDEHMNSMELARMLSDDFYSVFEVNLKTDSVIVSRISEFSHGIYGEQFATDPKYTALMERYISNEVIEEEQNEMRYLTSIEHLKEEFKQDRVYRHDFRIMRDEMPVYIRIKAVNLSEDDSEITRVVVGFANVDSVKREEWLNLAYFDQITGGHNLNYFNERLKRQTRPGFIVSLDIKSFRIVNMACGIEIGDYVLIRTSRIIEDVLGSRGFYGHLTADHFVLFIDVEDKAEVVAILKEIIDRFEYVVTGNIPKISPCFGVKSWKPGDRNQVAMSAAENAKLRVKNIKGKNIAFYRPEDNAAAIEKKSIEDAFETAIREGQFEIWYQPKFDTSGTQLHGAEALVRWRKPDGKLVSPNSFIPVYEKNGMIRQLDRYVFNMVCRQQNQWLDDLGFTVPVTVNMSRISLYYQGIVDDYTEILHKEGVKPELVPLEITETAAIENTNIKEMSEAFHNEGFRLHMDDFGTGYSALSTINSVKFDAIKLDKSLVDYIGENSGDCLIKHTVALAKDLGILVVAEGVETEAQVNFLKEVECDSIQGYYFSKPLPKNDFTEMLIDRHLN